MRARPVSLPRRAEGDAVPSQAIRRPQTEKLEQEPGTSVSGFLVGIAAKEFPGAGVEPFQN